MLYFIIGIVSIPYGKGKDKLRDLREKAFEVSIPYGKGKV